MAHDKKAIDADALTSKRFSSVARLLHDSFTICRGRVLEKLTSRGHPYINLSHSVVLRHIDVEGTPLSVVTRRAGVSRQAVAKVARQLEVVGYLATLPDPTDRRAKVLKLTPRGMLLFAACIEAYEAFEEELAQRIGRRRLEQFRITLQMISHGHRRDG